VELPSAEFYCRKGFYSLAVLAMVDSHYRFTFVCCRNPGATHDLTVFRGSTLYAYIHHLKKLDKDFWIVGDEAFCCTEFMITPYPGSEVKENNAKSAFNYHLSRL